MKKSLLIISCLFFAVQLVAREVYEINRNWRFFSNEDDAEQRVNLPHMWNYDALGGERDYYRGLGNYQKDINIPAVWKGKRVFLRGYGANSVSDLLVNSKHVGEHKGGYTAFTYEITDYLEYGRRNFLWLMVNNAPRMDVLPISGDANSYGGLFRDVELIVTERNAVSLTDHSSDGVYILQKSVTPQRVEAEAMIKVDGVEDKGLTASLSVYDQNGRLVADGQHRFRISGDEDATVKIPFSIDGPTLWHGTQNPYMYSVSVRISDGARITDSLRIMTGFRKVEADTRGNFKLNGEPYKLKGVVLHQDRAMTGSAITPYQVLEDFEFVREIGANIVRVAGVAHHPYFYELCDRYGIMVWSDFPLVGPIRRTDRSFVNSEPFLDNLRTQAMETMAQQYNHPSVVMWGLFSNIRFRGEDPTVFLTNLNSTVKKDDPARLTVASSNQDGNVNMIPDLIVWDHHFGWQEGLPSDISKWQRQLHNDWTNFRSGVSYAAGASIYHQEDSLNRPDYLGNWHPERWQTHFHEVYYNNLVSDRLLWGIFVGNLFDYGAAMRTWGEGNGINDCGLVTFDRKYRKDAFYFYKANWNNTEPFVYIAERRWSRRNSRVQKIKVYTNQPDVTLVVNGTVRGTVKTGNGVCVWENVELKEGMNIIGARNGDVTDMTLIDIRSRGAGYGIR